MEDARRQFAGLIDVERVAVGTPGDRLFTLIESGDWSRIAAGYRIKISPLIGTDGGDLLRIGREDEGGTVHALVRDGLSLAGLHVIYVKPHALVGLVGGEQNPVAIREPVRPAVIDVVFGEIARFAGTSGQ